jgi:uncharacterized protein (DUF1778 family)
MASNTKDERLDLRLPAQLKRTIERAAALSGQTVTTFILGTTVRRARRVIREANVIELSDRDRDRFLAALDNTDARPNAALLRAAERHKAATG